MWKSLTKSTSRTCNATLCRVENSRVRVDNSGRPLVHSIRDDDRCIDISGNTASQHDLDAASTLSEPPRSRRCDEYRILLLTASRCCKPRHLLGITCIFCASVTAESRLAPASAALIWSAAGL